MLVGEASQRLSNKRRCEITLKQAQWTLTNVVERSSQLLLLGSCLAQSVKVSSFQSPLVLGMPWLLGLMGKFCYTGRALSPACL